MLLCAKADTKSFTFIHIFEELCQLLDFTNKYDEQNQLQAGHYAILLEWLVNVEQLVYQKLQHLQQQPEQVSFQEMQSIPKLLLLFLPSEIESETLPIRVVEHMKSMNVDVTPYSLGLLIHKLSTLEDARCFVLFHHMEHELRIPSNIATLKCLMDFLDVVHKQQLITDGDVEYVNSRAIALATKLANNSSQFYLLPKETISCILHIFQKTQTPIPKVLYDSILEKKFPKQYGSGIDDGLHKSLQIWSVSLIENAIHFEDFESAKRVAQAMLQAGLIPDAKFFYRMEKLYEKGDPRIKEIISILNTIRKDGRFSRMGLHNNPATAVSQFRQENNYTEALKLFNSLKEKQIKLEFLDYIHIIKLASSKRDVSAFSLLIDLKKDFPEKKPYKAYQAIFHNFYFREYQDLLWSVYSNYFRMDTDGKDGYVYSQMLRHVQRGSDREKLILSDIQKFGFQRRTKASLLDQQYQDSGDYDVASEFSQKNRDKFYKEKV